MNSVITSQAAQQNQRLLVRDSGHYDSVPSNGSGMSNSRKRTAVMSLKSLHNVMGFVIGPYSEMEVPTLIIFLFHLDSCLLPLIDFTCP